MSKIFNWFFGSFFRTLGRVLVFMLLGYILFSFLNLNDIKLPDIFGVLNVSADVDLASPSFNSQTIYKSIGNSEQVFTTYETEVFNGRTYLYNTFTANVIAITGSFWKFDINNQGVFNRIEFKTYTRNAQPTSAIIRIQGTNDKENFIYLTDELTCDISNNVANTSSSAYIYSYYCDIPKIDYTYNYYRLFIYVNGMFPNRPEGGIDAAVYYGINRWLTLYNKDNNSTINESIKDQTEQNHQDSVNTQDKIDNVNDSINNSDTTDASNEANGFFNNFSTNTHGLTGIITAPLNAINSLTNKSCSPLKLPLPFVNKDLTLPCMRDIYDTHFGTFMTIYDTITLGIVSYWVCVRIFSLVKDFKNPEHDEVEVVDL